MRAALLLSGYLRTFKINLPVLKEKIIKKFDNIDVYIHITRDEKRQDKYLNEINENYIQYIINVLNPVAIIIENNIEDKEAAYNKWVKLFKLNTVKKTNEKIFGKYDIVIKCRPDVNIISDISFDKPHDKISIPAESLIDKNKLLTPTDSYICDVFAFGSSELMDRYFNIFLYLDKLIAKYGPVPETVLYNYLNSYEIPYKEIDIKFNVILSTCNVFALCGDSGSGKTTLANILKKYFNNAFTMECDRYHRWERNDEKWKAYTHLNPDANYITKMNKDIFDLKIGKEIYQINYDHFTGKFTEQQKIQKSDNLIVCGLHSLYNNHELYNLKIFIDTDIFLKTKWKVQRDISERGYSYEDVFKQIKEREQDYYKYIYPQRKNSDIVVNFFTDNKDTTNLDNNNELKLRLFIKKKFNILNILANLTKYSIPFETEFNKDNDFNQIIFNKFVDTELISDLPYKTNSFYDYIVYTIFALAQNECV